MKEATGELNMTVVTLVAISAIAALFMLIVWPMIQTMLMDNTCQTYGDNWFAVKTAGQNGADDVWSCCPAGQNGGRPASASTDCFAAQ